MLPFPSCASMKGWYSWVQQPNSWIYWGTRSRRAIGEAGWRAGPRRYQELCICFVSGRSERHHQLCHVGPRRFQIILKAASGGGGRGIRVLTLPTQSDALKRAVTEAYGSCSREASASFNDGTVYAERFLTSARHVEVQILGDGRGGVCHFWDRECSLQRRNQKMIEIAPAPHISDKLREVMVAASFALTKAVRLRSLATIEFLVEEGDKFYFMEANPGSRLNIRSRRT